MKNVQPESPPSRTQGESDAAALDRMWETYPWRQVWKYPLAPRAGRQPAVAAPPRDGNEEENIPCAS